MNMLSFVKLREPQSLPSTLKLLGSHVLRKHRKPRRGEVPPSMVFPRKKPKAEVRIEDDEGPDADDEAVHMHLDYEIETTDDGKVEIKARRGRAKFHTTNGHQDD